ncbi:MAG: hypothetical protein H0U70_03610 [Tatlockia sp.]|nr:hypothetical protein [Tatlockia sp.]
MSESKSKFPDLKEISSMAGKLFNDVKKSVSEIYCEYKKNHAEPAPTEPVKPQTTYTSTKTEETVIIEKPVRTPTPRKPKVVVDKVVVPKDDNTTEN